MNKLITNNNGGFPLVLDDVRFIMDAYTSAFKGILNAFAMSGENAVILSGCQKTVSAGLTTISEGFVGIDGEVCYVGEHSYINPSAGEKEYWDIQLGLLPAGEKLFQNGDTNFVYQSRVGAVLKALTVPAGKSLYNANIDIYRVIATRLPRLSPEVIDSKSFSGVDYDITAHIDLNGYMHVDSSDGYPVDLVVGTVVTDQFLGLYTPLKATTYTLTVNTGPASFTTIALLLSTGGELKITAVESGGSTFGFINLGELPPIYVGV